MIKVEREKIYWIIGITIALAGVAVLRLLASELFGIAGKVVIISGYILSLTGIIIIARAAKI
jgi:hypothetical protein